MQDFFLYSKIGFDHITDTGAYDHILFVLTLCTAFNPSDWKKTISSVTAFTLGHSLSLALSVLGWVEINASVIELLISLTIMWAASENIYWLKKSKKQCTVFKYFEISFFGLIHGLGFSYYLKALLGQSDSLVLPLFGFNMGLEFGQIIVIALFFVLLRFVALPKVLSSKRLAVRSIWDKIKPFSSLLDYTYFKIFYLIVNIAVLLLASQVFWQNLPD